MKPELHELDRLHKEAAKLNAEHDNEDGDGSQLATGTLITAFVQRVMLT